MPVWCMKRHLSIIRVSDEPGDKPQTLLFSATVPRWVQQTARKYLRSDIVKLDLVGQGTVRTATSVEVHYIDLICGCFNQYSTV